MLFLNSEVMTRKFVVKAALVLMKFDQILLFIDQSTRGSSDPSNFERGFARVKLSCQN